MDAEKLRKIEGIPAGEKAKAALALELLRSSKQGHDDASRGVAQHRNACHAVDLSAVLHRTDKRPI
jgi:hypothetical protein